MNWPSTFRPALLLCFPAFVYCAYSGAQQAQNLQGSPFSLEANVNRVLVPVVVRDAHGDVVSGLKEEDFHVFDRGKPLRISGFTVQQRAVPVTATTGSARSDQPQPAPAATPPQLPAPSQRYIVFLFDDMNLKFEDLAHTQKACEKAMTDELTDSDMAAVVSTSGQTNSGLTRDRAKLQAAIMSLRTIGLHRLEISDNCMQIDYYEADQILNHTDGGALREARQQWVKCHY